MKAAVIYRYGGPEELEYEDMPDPVAGRGKVVLRVAAAGVNPVDGLDRSGGTKDWRPLTFPAIIGWDVAGTVETVGDGVTAFAPGDRVMGWAFSTYAEKVAVAANLLVPVPDAIDLIEAAALPLGAMTGSQLILAGADVEHGQSVLVAGALGMVGRAAVFAAREKGAKVIAGVREHQIAEAETLGADRLVALDDERALASLGEVDVVANTVRGPITARLLPLLARGGTFASATGAPDAANSRPDVHVVSFVSKQDIGNLAYIARAASGGRLVMPATERLPLAQAREAHRRLAAGGAGKMLLLP